MRTLIQRWKFDVGRSFFNPVLVIEYWKLRFLPAFGMVFVIWCLEFVILDTKLQGRAIYLLLPQCGIFDGPRGPGFQCKNKGAWDCSAF